MSVSGNYCESMPRMSHLSGPTIGPVVNELSSKFDCIWRVGYALIACSLVCSMARIPWRLDLGIEKIHDHLNIYTVTGLDCHRETEGSREGSRDAEKNGLGRGGEEFRSEQDYDGAEADGEEQCKETTGGWKWSILGPWEEPGRC